MTKPPARPRRIGFYFFTLAAGGVERMRVSLAGELLARGYDVDFVLCRAEGELRPLVPAGVRLIDLQVDRSLASIGPLVRYFRDDPPDAMFSSLGHQNVAAIIARKLAKSKVWLGVMQHNALSEESHSGLSLQHRLLPLAYRFALPYADRVLAVSEGVADDLATAAHYPRERIGVLYNPACPEGVDEAAKIRPDHPFFDGPDPVLVGVGRLTYQKGWDTLLKAFARVVEQRPARLLIAGVGPDEADLRALTAELGLSDRVDLVGFQKVPLAWMAAGDLAVMSSRYEGFGNVLVEALATGTPVVSTDCNYGPSEILEKGKYGTLAPVDDVEGLAAAIVQELDHPHDANMLRERAQDFTVARVTDRYLKEAFGAAA
jgi:glycosyltransferase involved in cell wall biosynthesis